MTKEPKTLEDWIGFSKDDFSSLLSPPVKKEPIETSAFRIPLKDIREETEEEGFLETERVDAQSIAKIGFSIQQKGVKCPICVRHDKKNPGKFIINDGVRRFRGAKWAKETTIPAFIDDTYTKNDHIIETIHKKKNNPLDIALFIQTSAMKKTALAQLLGKSPSFISRYGSLLGLPCALRKKIEDAKIKDLTLINEIHVVWKKNPQDVLFWLEEESVSKTRSSMRRFRALLKKKYAPREEKEKKKSKEIKLRARHRGVEGVVLLEKKAEHKTICFFRSDKGEESLVPFSALQIIGIV